MKNYLIMLVFGMIMVSCTTTQPLYNWKGYDDAVYSYTKSGDEKSEKNLIAMYEKLIKNSGGSRKVPPPGVLADYGFILASKGQAAKGKELLIKETILYPESKPFVDLILKRLEK